MYAVPMVCAAATPVMNTSFGYITECDPPFHLPTSYPFPSISLCSSSPNRTVAGFSSPANTMMSTNAGRTMLPLRSLLNPDSPDQQNPQSRQSSPAFSSSSVPFFEETLRSAADRTFISKSRLSRGSSSMTKPKPQGPINFAPFEDVDQKSFEELSNFGVSPFGQIHQCCEHIPYNSSKKDFFEKTGRESIEVFKYEFRLPGEDRCYTVMWDYNVGLVRMTPFFKCLGYPKTKPSQMLDKNPGLRDISPSVTGGSVSAQGYWMPYRCAKAVCATFCYRIAGALIPVFGPSFPSECTPPESPYYKEMVISQQVVIEATREVELFRHVHKSRIARALSGTAGHPQLEDYPFHGKNESKSAPSFMLPSRPQPLWNPLNSAENYGPMANSAPSTGFDARGLNTMSRAGSSSSFANRPSSERDPFRHVNPFLNALPRLRTVEPQRAFTEKWRLKRRRRVHESPTKPYPAAAMDIDQQAAEKKRPEQELDQFKAAAVLVSLQRERHDSAAVDSSDEDSPGGTLRAFHQKKRPKAHSF